MVDSGGNWRYNKSRKVSALSWWACPTWKLNQPPRSASYMAALLLLIFLDEGQKQPDNKGQDRKLDHDHFIIRHYAHPLFFSESGAKRRERAARLAVEDSAQALRRPRTRAPHLCVGAGEATPCRNLPADIIVTDYGLKSNETQRNRPSRTRRAIYVFLSE